MSVRAWLLAGGCALGAFASGCRATQEEPPELPFPLVLQFEGEKTIDEATLDRVVRAELARLEVTEPDKAAVDDAAFALELYYRGRGHADVLVEYDFETSPGGEPLARFRITEGPVVHVRELVLEGLKTVDQKTVREAFGDAARGGIYDEQHIAKVIDDLRDRYLTQGHLRVDIDEPEIKYDQSSSSVRVRIVVHEGPAFRVKEVTVRGCIPELQRRQEQLAGKYETSDNNTYTPRILGELEHALIEDHRRRGYPDVAVEARADMDETSGDVHVVVEVTPGELVRVAHFRIEGNERAKEAAILSLMGIERGSVYDSDVVRSAFRDLYATGLFESVKIELEGGGTDRTLAVEVVEARSVEIHLEPGWGSFEGPRLLVGIEENNFQGRGQVLSLEGTISLRAQGVRASWIDRNFLGTRFTAETTAFVEQREEPSFEYVRRGLGFFLRRHLGPDWSTAFGYEYRPTNVTDDEFDSFSLALDDDPSIDDDSSVAALSVTLWLEDRDNPLLPTRGRQGRARLEWADDLLGSDTEFLYTQLEYSHTLRLSERGVLVASARTGVIKPFGITDQLPISERLFNGGENTVRSFEEDELAAEGSVSGQFLGGEAATTFNLELRRMITGNLAGAVFADYGNLVEQAEDYWQFEGFRPGIGVGVRYMLPIGPMRLDLGYNPDAEEDEDEYVLHFSVGFPF